MQRNYPRMFSPADDQDKDGFKLENVRERIQKIQKEGAETDDAVLHHSGSICDQTLGSTLRTFQKYRKKRGGGGLGPWPPDVFKFRCRNALKIDCT